MNKLKLITVFLLLVLTLSSALAVFEAGDVKLGDSSQERGETVVETFTVKNTGSLDIKDAEVAFSGVAGKYDAVATLSSTSIAAGGEITLTVEAFIAYDLDAVDSKGRKIAEDIGDIVLTGLYSDDTDVPQKTLTFLMEAENMLEFKTGSKGSLITIDGDESRLKDGQEYDGGDGVRREADIVLKIVVENNFNDNDECDDDDCDMDDVEITIDSSDRDLDVDSEDLDPGDVKPEDYESDTFDFEIPDDADDRDKFDVDIWVTGEDPWGALHGDSWSFELEVEVPDDEVIIREFDLSPSRLSCGDNRATLRVTVENTGDKDQDEVSIWIESTRLDIKESIYHLDLEEGDTTTRTFALTLPEDLDVGQYFIQIIANVDHSDETDRQTATLNVEECSLDDDDLPSDDDSDITVIEVPPITGGVIYGEDKKQGFFDSTEYVIMLGGFFFIALMMFFILLAVLLKK